jgi:hypothetical protein
MYKSELMALTQHAAGCTGGQDAGLYSRVATQKRPLGVSKGTSLRTRHFRSLTERDADSMLFAPYDAAGPMQSIARHHQYESLRDSGLVGDL